MGDIQSVPGLSANLKKAVCWLSETVQEKPGISRDTVLNEAQLRFDLTPRECEFLDKNFRRLASETDR